MPDKGLICGTDGKMRCWWCGDDAEYIRYHDEEWGKPVRDDRRMFEKICLEGFQSGLSWLTILRKRENFRKAFHDFDDERISLYTEKDIERLLQDAGIVRHRGKIEAVINNAARAIELKKETGSLAEFFWSFEPDPKSRPKKMDYKTLTSMPTSEASLALSKALKKRGWKFVGPTTCYAFMQSMGIVNDHLDGCHTRHK
ncbi:MAG: DNA-3-methyladenine glycosylase I [Alphaproteobacteria bacterium]|jgi:DNA-3-methyladenine glycosylase I|nr:DNA-3-methyladenine glycosylase I [Alphaproteobacteria bacterium]QQS57374.1 MAG: DNA-3-methyladenine glycosylase I [Alphaproteobacteria bacterium]